jgi:hypothetical protein
MSYLCVDCGKDGVESFAIARCDACGKRWHERRTRSQRDTTLVVGTIILTLLVRDVIFERDYPGQPLSEKIFYDGGLAVLVILVAAMTVYVAAAMMRQHISTSRMRKARMAENKRRRLGPSSHD